MRKLVLCVVMGFAVPGGFMAGGCSDGPQKPLVANDKIARGSIQMELQTVSDSGKVYRLRQAVFPVSMAGGVIFGNAGSPGAGGLVGAAGDFSVPPPPPSPIPIFDAGMSAGGQASTGGFFNAGGAFPETGGSGGGSTSVILNSEDDPSKTVLEAFLNPGSYQVQLLDGWFVEQVDELLGTAAFVPATLLSSSLQFFDIQSNDETFVKFDFEVDGHRVTFGPPGRLIVGIGVHETNGSCGNGVMDPGESCDGNDLGGQTCASATFGSLPDGFLFCTEFCTLDISFCTGGQGGFGGIGGTFGDGGPGGIGGTFGGDAGPGGFGGFGGSTGGSAGSGGASGDMDAGAGGVTSTGGKKGRK